MAEQITIQIKRESLRTRLGLTWTYSWTTPEPIHYRDASGEIYNSVPAGTWISYGKGIIALRDMLKRKFGPNVKLIETWKAGA